MYAHLGCTQKKNTPASSNTRKPQKRNDLFFSVDSRAPTYLVVVGRLVVAISACFYLEVVCTPVRITRVYQGAQWGCSTVEAVGAAASLERLLRS